MMLVQAYRSFSFMKYGGGQAAVSRRLYSKPLCVRYLLYFCFLEYKRRLNSPNESLE